MTRARGIDVSSVQGQVDWQAVAGAGFSFAFLKATEGGGYVDPTFARNVAGARDAGLLVGAYHFLTVGASTDAQATTFLRAVAGLGLELPLVIDVEYPPPEKWDSFRGSADVIGRALYIVNRIEEETGAQPLIYTYPYWMHAAQKDAALSELATRCPLWIASYKTGTRVPTDAEQPDVPAPWQTWRYWQTSGDVGAPVPGVRGACDQNAFNGTVEQLRPPPPVETAPTLPPDSGPAAA